MPVPQTLSPPTLSRKPPERIVRKLGSPLDPKTIDNKVAVSVRHLREIATCIEHVRKRLHFSNLDKLHRISVFTELNIAETRINSILQLRLFSNS